MSEKELLNLDTKITRRSFLKILTLTIVALLFPSILNKNESKQPRKNTIPDTKYAEFIKQKIEQQPYLSPAAGQALIYFFKANNHIQPVFLSRQEWEKKDENQKYHYL